MSGAASSERMLGSASFGVHSGLRRRMGGPSVFPRLLAAAIAGGCCGAAFGQTHPESTSRQLRPGLILDRCEYSERLEGMWLAENIANWTGLRTEGCWKDPPFPTDESWGGDCGQGKIEFVFLDPWPADDDTDIEYTYVHLLDKLGVAALSGKQIAEGWRTHINQRIWVSNEAARGLMGRGVVPPATSLPAGNPWWLMIDAQLTTEVFGALAPGMPAAALENGLLPMLTTSRGHATHASQYFALLYALAPLIPENLTPTEQVLWLSTTARLYIPDSSKAADIIDFVTADFLANPDPDDWERTRDAIYRRYHAGAEDNGFRYRGWTESSVNLANGVMCLLYGGGDFRRTVQIGALGGWDSDNPTATIGGLLGLMHGRKALEDAFPGQEISERYWIRRTRDAMPDYLPDDPAAEDTFPMLAARMISIIDRVVEGAGGVVDEENDRWIIPCVDFERALQSSPTERLCRRSANNWVRSAGGTVTASSSIQGQPAGREFSVDLIADGVEFDYSGVEPAPVEKLAYSTRHPGGGAGESQSVRVEYDCGVLIDRVVFIEGDCAADAQGGWFTDLSLEVRIDGVWFTSPAGTTLAEPLAPELPFQMLEFRLPRPVEVTGVRVTGRAGGVEGWATVAELDAFRAPPRETGRAGGIR